MIQNTAIRNTSLKSFKHSKINHSLTIEYTLNDRRTKVAIYCPLLLGIISKNLRYILSP